MRVTIGLVVACVLGATACKKKPTAEPSAGSGSAAAAGPTTPVAPGSAVAAPFDAKAALDDALAARHVGADAVKKCVVSAASAWAVIGAKANDAGELIEIDVLAARRDGIAEAKLVPPAATKSTFDDVVSFEAKDLDGDGTDEGLLVLTWTRDTKVPGEEEGWAVSTDEWVTQLYVLVGTTPSLRTAFAHVISYETQSEGMPEDNPTPYPEPEHVAYDWSVVAGTPPIVKLTRTKSEVAAKDRLRGVLDPASDPLFAAGSGKDLPIAVP